MELCALCGIEQKQKDLIVISTDYNICAVPYESLKKGHIMILPKKHILRWDELSYYESSDLFGLIERFGKIISENYGSAIAGINFSQHQSQRHIHVHIIPSKARLSGLFSYYENIHKSRKSYGELIEFCRAIKKLT